MVSSINTTPQLILHLYRENPLWTDPTTRFTSIGPVYQIEDGSQVVIEQANAFDQHTINVKDVELAAIHALEGNIYVEIEQVGAGVIALGRVVTPTQEMIETGEGRIGLTLENVTEELSLVRTGPGYRDSQEISRVVSNLGSVTYPGESVFDYSKVNKDGVPGYDDYGREITIFTDGRSTGWSAEYLPSNTYIPTVAPVDWTGGVFGGWRYATFNGNTLTADPAHVQAWDGGGIGYPNTYDLTHDFSYAFQIIDPGPSIQTGLSATIAIGQFSIDFAFYLHDGLWQITENGILVNGLGGVAGGNAAYTIALNAPTGEIMYYVNGAKVYTSHHSPHAPLAPIAVFGSQQAQVTNPIIYMIATDERYWVPVSYDDPSLLNAFVSLSKDTDTYVRLGRDVNGKPIRKLEVGVFGNLTKMRLIDGSGSDPESIRNNINARLVKTIKQTGPDMSNVANIITAVGGAGNNQVNLQHLWQIENDAKYENFGKYKGGYNEKLGNYFPEKDDNYTIHRTPTDSAGYSYYVRSEASYAAYGPRVGGQPDSTYTYQTDALNNAAYTELTERGLYSATIGKFRKNDQPHFALDVVTTWNRYTPRAAEMLTVDYTGYGYVNGVFVSRMKVNDTFYVMKVLRTFGAEITDTWTLSNLGRYLPSDGSVQAETLRQQRAMQVVQNTATSVSILPPVFRELDAGNDPLFPGDHSVVYPIKLLSTAFRVEAAFFHVEFLNFRQTVTTADGGLHHHTVQFTIPDHYHAPVANLVTDKAAIGGVPLHVHQFAAVGGAIGAPTGTSLWLDAFFSSSLGYYLLRMNNGSGGTFKTGAQITYNPTTDLAPTSANHPISGVAVGNTVRLTDTHIGDTLSFSTATSDDGLHSHDLLPKIRDNQSPSRILVYIDSGDGVFVDRTASLLNILTNSGQTEFTSTFEFECARYIDSPGRTVRLKFVSLDGGSGNPYGLGCLAISGTIAVSYNGVGEIIRQIG